MAPANRPVLPKINTHVPPTTTPKVSRNSASQAANHSTSKQGVSSDGQDGHLKVDAEPSRRNRDENEVVRKRPDLPVPATPIVVPPTPASASGDYRGDRQRARSPAQESVSEEEEDEEEEGKDEQEGDGDNESPGYVQAESPSEYHEDEDEQERETKDASTSPSPENETDADDVQLVSTPEEEDYPPVQITESPTTEEPEEQHDYVEFESPVDEHELSQAGSSHGNSTSDQAGRQSSSRGRRGDAQDDSDDDDEADKDIAELARRKLEIDPDARSSSDRPTGSTTDPRSRWAKIRQRARQRMDSEESNTTMGADKPSRSNTVLLSSIEQDKERDSNADGVPEDEVSSPVEMMESPKSGSSSPDRGVHGAGHRLAPRRDVKQDDRSSSRSTRSRSRSGSRPPQPIAGTFLAKSPKAIHETASLPVPLMGSDESAGTAAGSSSSADGTRTPYWSELATSPMAGVLSGESEDESTRPATMNREKPGPGPWPSRRRSSNSPSPRPDLLKVSSSQSSLARSAPNSPRIKPAKGEREATASPVSKAKSTTRANSNPPELDLNDRELGAELRSRLSGHPGHARRNSSTHRVLETLDAKHHANEKGQRMVNQYALGPLIGRGAYGNVEKGIDVGTGQEYAIKEFSKSRLKRQQQLSSASRIRKPKFEEDSANQGSDDRGTSKAKGNVKGKGKGKDDDEDPLALIRREIAVMKKLDHPNLVLLYEAINVNTSDSLYLVLEYVPGGTLMDIKVGGKPSKSLDKEKARSYFRQLTLGLEYLHSAGVTHRDIKPDNVLLSADRTQVKLCDFGVSEMFTAGDDRMKKSGGSPAFMSPEAAILTQGDVHAKPVDIWAMGVTLYCMLRGSLPFEADNPLDLFEAIKEQEPHIPPEWDDDVKDLVSRMLKKDPDERMVIEEMREHPWVTKNGEDPMPTTDQNLYEIGKQVEEPSEEEVGNAISTFRASFTVILAIQKMRRMYRRRRGLSSSGSSNSAWSTPTMLSPATEHPPGANNNNDNKSNNNNNKPNLGLLGASGLSSISPNGVADGHVTSPEEIEEKDKDGDRGGGASDYFGSRGSGGARRE